MDWSGCNKCMSVEGSYMRSSNQGFILVGRKGLGRKLAATLENTILNRIQRMIQCNVRNLIPGIFMNHFQRKVAKYNYFR